SSPAGADQLGSLLRPDATAARKDPCRPDGPVVICAAHDDRVDVGRNGHRRALACGRSQDATTDQLGTLLCPDTSAAREDPSGPDKIVVIARPADDRCVAVGRNGDCVALGYKSRPSIAAHELGSLL